MKHLVPHFIQDQYQKGNRHGYLTAGTLFVDLSGFTPLTEELMRKGNAGAEELSVLLNEIFSPLVELVYARGGFIPYFAGDAFTAIFPDEPGNGSAQALLATALMARRLFVERESQFGKYTISIKTGLSFGRVEWGIVGEELRTFYFRGEPIDRCAYCQSLAGSLDIVIDQHLLDLLGPTPPAVEEVGWQAYRLAANLPVPQLPKSPAVLPDISREQALVFLPEPVTDYVGRGEFRTVITVFLSFEGIDRHEMLDRFASIVLSQIAVFSGYLKEIDFGDKGGVVTCFFGAPVSFENNLPRALEFILSLREEFQSMQAGRAFQFRAGMTIGTAFTGIVGGRERGQYAVVGNRVNLAARLMSFADWGEILVDEEIQRNKYFRFLHKGDIKYKGIKGNVPTFNLLGHNFEEKAVYGANPMIGRQEELQQLLDFSRPLAYGKPAGLAYIYGEAGIGKSRLAYEFHRQLLPELPVVWRHCPADQILRKPFNPFIYFLKDFFAQSPESNAYVNRTNFEARFRAVAEQLANSADRRASRHLRELDRTKPVLAALIGIAYEQSLWEQLDARGRYQNTLAAVINLIQAESLLHPLALELEDVHWIDESSQELVEELLRNLADYPVLLLATARYKDDGAKPYLADNEAEALTRLGLPRLEIDLNALTAGGVRTFAEQTLEGPISEEYMELLVRTTNNNPFYLEQVLEYFKESQLLTLENGRWTIKDKNIKLSSSINAILTARIDRLSALVRETVKAAAVIGREFEVPVLSEVMRAQEVFRSGNGANASLMVREQIKTGEQVQIWMAMNELRYIFRHSLLREAVYSMQLQAQLQQLHHLIAQAIEKLYPDQIEERYVDLAFHYEQAGVFDKTCEYLRKAADHARANYQNQQALDFYEKLLRKLGRQADIADEIATQLKRGKILELIGKWDEARQAFERALKLSKKSRDVVLLGKSNTSLGHLLMLRGEYDEALHYLQIAAGLFESVDDMNGIAKVYGDLGNLYFRRGNYDQAKAYFEQSLSTGYIQHNTAAGAQIVANLGLTHMNQGRYEAGVRVIQEQLERSQLATDKQGMAILFTNLGIVQFEKGDYDDALLSYESGLKLAEELGNKQLTAIALGCMGSVYERKGVYDRAMTLFQRDLELCEEMGDKQGIAIALGLLGELYSIKGEFAKAVDHLQKNLMLCESLGYQKGIAKAVNTLGDVFYFTGEYERSLHFYNRAIEVTRKIDNRLVLCASLIEKGAVLIALNRLDEVVQTGRDAAQIARELGNPDLIFESRLLEARIQHLHGHTQLALAELNGLEFQDGLTDDHLAAVLYERALIDPANQRARRQARERYEQLYDRTPRYLYRARLDMLSKEV